MATATLRSLEERLVSIHPHPAAPQPVKAVDVKALKRDLSKKVKGEVRFDRGTIAMYATDSSNFREIPIGVVIPKTIEDVVQTHRMCSRHGAPILNRGGGTSLSGETLNFAVVIDHSKMSIARKLGVPRLHGALPEQLSEPKPSAPASLKLSRTAASLGLFSLAALSLFRALSSPNTPPAAQPASDS